MASTSSRPHGLANRALKSSGLLRDQDTAMRDGTKAGPTRRKHDKKPGHRQRTMDLFKSSGSSELSNKMAVQRITGSLSNPLAVRGAASRSGVIRAGKSGTRSTAKPLEVWRELVQKRYNPESRFLNLENLKDEELLKKNRIVAPGQPGANRKEYPVIFKLASQLHPPVETISLANNNITAGIQLVPLSHYLPEVKNLSLQDNKLRTWRDIDYIAGSKTKKLTALRELIFSGNPLREQEVRSNRIDQYRSGMMRRFQSLQVLDQELLPRLSFNEAVPSTSDPIPQNLPEPNFFPHDMSPSFITGVDGSIISAFLSRFLPLFDTNRTALEDVYDSEATFSYTAYTQIPPRARIQGWHTSPAMPNQRKLDWGPWLNNQSGGSRNLSVIGVKFGVDREIRTLHKGPDEIIKTLNSLPGTMHEMAGAADKYCIDAWPVIHGGSSMLLLSLHGEFKETPSMGIRSFDRSFMLAIPPPGSRAAAANWPLSILSDQLTVRPYSSPQVWSPGPLSLQSEGVSTSKQIPSAAQGLTHQTTLDQRLMAPDVQAQLASIPDPQRSLIVALCQRTSMNVKFAIDCLQNNGWDAERAYLNFQQVKPTLGPEAYL